MPKSANLEDHGDISDYPGINFAKTKDGNLKLTQPRLINQIIEEVRLDRRRRRRRRRRRIRRRNSNPESSARILRQDIKAELFDHSFNFISVVSMVKCL